MNDITTVPAELGTYSTRRTWYVVYQHVANTAPRRYLSYILLIYKHLAESGIRHFLPVFYPNTAYLVNIKEVIRRQRSSS